MAAMNIYFDEPFFFNLQGFEESDYRSPVYFAYQAHYESNTYIGAGTMENLNKGGNPHICLFDKRYVDQMPETSVFNRSPLSKCKLYSTNDLTQLKIKYDLGVLDVSNDMVYEYDLKGRTMIMIIQNAKQNYPLLFGKRKRSNSNASNNKANNKSTSKKSKTTKKPASKTTKKLASRKPRKPRKPASKRANK